jgi:5-(carboxyamino)imidazole ribonucleotide mutase
MAVNGARNAGLLAVRILALGDQRLAGELEDFRLELADQARAQNAHLMAEGPPQGH